MPDPNNSSNPFVTHIHGGLFQVCYPGYGTHENGSYYLTGFEVCSPLTDMMPSPLTKSMTITNGLILASLVASSIMTGLVLYFLIFEKRSRCCGLNKSLNDLWITDPQWTDPECLNDAKNAGY